MPSSHHAEAMLQVLGSLAQIATSRANAEVARNQMQYQHAVAELQADTLKHLVDAVITRRIEVVQEGFLQVLQGFGAQAQHQMTQQDRYAAAELETSDPLRRIELRKRINDIDAELRQIRIDARLLYARMTEVVILIGGTAMRADDSLARQLMLTAPVL